ncbi:MAG: 4-(cytidine 5'-diphospho)-2-C-methyl-D-erythritol kinase [Planctomycetes bacterium]|nr:4-(cytidine 5'-diphospho)-2-C-methyl-D-erythritol kinase [Planctomycetota bacterium]
MIVCRTGSQIAIETPAKLNLFLEVLARRPDGFHEIETLMVAVDRYDSLTATLLVRGEFDESVSGGIELSCDWATGLRSGSPRCGGCWEPLPDVRGNLVFRALTQFRAWTRVAHGIRVALTKRIPAAAGLGGASSDAAAALVAANLLWNTQLSPTALQAFAATLGSDVPFFLQDAPVAVARGRGERLEPVQAIPRLHFVIVRPPIGLATPQVYRACQPAESPRDVGPLIAALTHGSTSELARHLHNQLAPAARGVTPWIARLADAFERAGTLGHQMSGSGSSYFGVAASANHARQIAARLRQRDVGTVFCASPVPCWRFPDGN